MKSPVGLYAGSFDPIHLGHIDLIHNALKALPRLIIGVGINSTKSGLFNQQERIELIRASLNDVMDQVEVTSFSGLVYDEARRLGATVIVRGLRDTTDFTFEKSYAGMISDVAPDLPVIWVPSSPFTSHIASSMIKQVAALGGDTTRWLPPIVTEQVKLKYLNINKKQHGP